MLQALAVALCLLAVPASLLAAPAPAEGLGQVSWAPRPLVGGEFPLPGLGARVQHEEPPEPHEDLPFLVPFSYAAGMVETQARVWSDLPFGHMAHGLALDPAAPPAGYVAGFALGEDGNYDGLLVRFGADGEVAWHLRVDTGPFDVLHGVAVAPDGSVVAAGYAFGADFTRTRMLAVKATAAGEVLWTRLVETSPSGAGDEAYDVAVDGAGNIVLAGTAADLEGEELRYQSAVVQLGPGGDVRFARRVSPPGALESLETVAVGADGSIVAAGRALTESDYHLLTVRLGPQGDLVGRAVHEAGVASTARAIAVAPNGDVVVAGARWTDFFTAAPLLVRFGPDLGPLWAQELRVAHHAFARDVVVGADGHAHVGGTALTYLGNLDAFVARVTPEGLALHVRIIDEPDSVDGFNPAAGVALTPDGLTVVTAGSARVPDGLEGALRMHLTRGPAGGLLGAPAGAASTVLNAANLD